jgi:ketosteroid isomerase-like protein
VGDDETAVLAANRAFYAAFSARDLGAMTALWSERVPVGCVHPGWNPLRSREQVMRAWAAIFRGPQPPSVMVDQAQVTFVGDVALVVCREQLRSWGGARTGTLVATNVFVREGGGWRLAHHHAGPLADASDDDELPAPEPTPVPRPNKPN